MNTNCDGATIYTPAELTAEARRAVKGDARAAGTTARFVGWTLAIRGGRVSLIATGRTRRGSVFSVSVAI